MRRITRGAKRRSKNPPMPAAAVAHLINPLSFDGEAADDLVVHRGVGLANADRYREHGGVYELGVGQLIPHLGEFCSAIGEHTGMLAVRSSMSRSITPSRGLARCRSADWLRILGAPSALAPHRSGWEHDQVGLEVSLKDAEGPDQKVILQAWLAGGSRLVARFRERDLDHALAAARRDLIRQIEDERSRREPASAVRRAIA
jgi:hypothetical protein